MAARSAFRIALSDTNEYRARRPGMFGKRVVQLRSLRGARRPDVSVPVAVGAAAGSVEVVAAPDELGEVVLGAAVLPEGVVELGDVVLLGGCAPDDVVPPGVMPGPAPPCVVPGVVPPPPGLV